MQRARRDSDTSRRRSPPPGIGVVDYPSQPAAAHLVSLAKAMRTPKSVGVRGGTTMGNAKYVGRVGALAVALGIGTAVATTPWVAVAEPSADSSSASGSSSSDASTATDSTNTDDSKPAAPTNISGGAHTTPDTREAAEPTGEDSDSESEGGHPGHSGTPGTDRRGTGGHR